MRNIIAAVLALFSFRFQSPRKLSGDPTVSNRLCGWMRPELCLRMFG